VHTLRHSFAVHFLEQGLDLHYLQDILGHKYLQTTALYNQLTQIKITDFRSPFEEI
jgi:integrase/recombinase XerD